VRERRADLYVHTLIFNWVIHSLCKSQFDDYGTVCRHTLSSAKTQLQLLSKVRKLISCDAGLH